MQCAPPGPAEMEMEKKIEIDAAAGRGPGASARSTGSPPGGRVGLRLALTTVRHSRGWGDVVPLHRPPREGGVRRTAPPRSTTRSTATTARAVLARWSTFGVRPIPADRSEVSTLATDAASAAESRTLPHVTMSLGTTLAAPLRQDRFRIAEMTLAAFMQVQNEAPLLFIGRAGPGSALAAAT